MKNKLFIGSLDYSVTDAQLEELFATVGKVLSANVIVDRDTGQGKGFGFVEMENEEMARYAMNQLNGSKIVGRAIVIKEAKKPVKR